MTDGRGVDLTGHSKRDNQYMSIQYTMAHSPAWRSLSGHAIKVYIELRTRFHGGNNGKIFLSMEEGSGLLGLSSPQ